MVQATRDHVFPKSWYPKSTPPGVQQWVVPSCARCNKLHGRNEEYLLVRLGLTYAQDHPVFGDIAAKAQRAIDPRSGKKKKDGTHRENLRRTIQRELISAGPELNPHALFPLDPTAPEGRHFAVGLRPDALNILAEKLTRGIAYIYDGTYIADSHRFIVQHLHAPMEEIHAMLRRHGVHAEQGPGIQALWVAMKEDPQTRGHYYSILGRWQVYVFAVPKDLAERAAAERQAQLATMLSGQDAGDPSE
jgi:hypothetical protein